MSTPKTQPQAIRRIRDVASKIADEMGMENFEITIEDVRLLVLCRSIGYGQIDQISVVEGKPSGALRVTERYDFKKELTVVP